MSQENWIDTWECKDKYGQHDLIDLAGDTGVMFCTRCRIHDYVEICIACKKSIDPRILDTHKTERDTIYVWHVSCPV